MAGGGAVTVEAVLAAARAGTTVPAAEEAHPPTPAAVVVAAAPGLAVAAHPFAAVMVKGATKVAMSVAEVVVASAEQALPALKLCDVCFAKQVKYCRLFFASLPSLILPRSANSNTASHRRGVNRGLPVIMIERKLLASAVPMRSHRTLPPSQRSKPDGIWHVLYPVFNGLKQSSINGRSMKTASVRHFRMRLRRHRLWVTCSMSSC